MIMKTTVSVIRTGCRSWLEPATGTHRVAQFQTLNAGMVRLSQVPPILGSQGIGPMSRGTPTISDDSERRMGHRGLSYRRVGRAKLLPPSGSATP